MDPNQSVPPTTPAQSMPPQPTVPPIAPQQPLQAPAQPLAPPTYNETPKPVRVMQSYDMTPLPPRGGDQIGMRPYGTHTSADPYAHLKQYDRGITKGIITAMIFSMLVSCAGIYLIGTFGQAINMVSQIILYVACGLQILAALALMSLSDATRRYVVAFYLLGALMAIYFVIVTVGFGAVSTKPILTDPQQLMRIGKVAIWGITSALVGRYFSQDTVKHHFG